MRKIHWPKTPGRARLDRFSGRRGGLWERPSCPRRLMGNVVQPSPTWLRPGKRVCGYPPQFCGVGWRAWRRRKLLVARTLPEPRRKFVVLLTGGQDDRKLSPCLVGLFGPMSASPRWAENLGRGAMSLGLLWCCPWAAGCSLGWSGQCSKGKRLCLVRMLTWCLCQSVFFGNWPLQPGEC